MSKTVQQILQTRKAVRARHNTLLQEGFSLYLIVKNAEDVWYRNNVPVCLQGLRKGLPVDVVAYSGYRLMSKTLVDSFNGGVLYLYVRYTDNAPPEYCCTVEGFYKYRVQNYAYYRGKAVDYTFAKHDL